MKPQSRSKGNKTQSSNKDTDKIERGAKKHASHNNGELDDEISLVDEIIQLINSSSKDTEDKRATKSFTADIRAAKSAKDITTKVLDVCRKGINVIDENALNAIINNMDVRFAREAFHKLCKLGFYNNTTFNHIIKIASHYYDFKLLQAAYDEALKKKIADGFTFSNYIHYLDLKNSNLARIQDAYALAKKMKKVDSVLVNTYINILGRKNCFDLASLAFTEAKKNKLTDQRTVSTYMKVLGKRISCCNILREKKLLLKNAYTLYQKTFEKQPHLITTTIQALGLNGMYCGPGSAVEIYKEAIKKPEKLCSASMFSCFIEIATENNKYGDALSAFIEARKHGHADAEVYSSIVKSAIQNKDFNTALQHLKDAVNNLDSSVHAQVFCTAMSSAVDLGDSEWVDRFYDFAKESNCVDTLTYSIYLDAAYKFGQKTEQLLTDIFKMAKESSPSSKRQTSKMKEDERKTQSTLYMNYIKAISTIKGGHGAKLAYDAYNDACHRNIVDKRLVSTIIPILGSCGKFTIACKIFEKAQKYQARDFMFDNVVVKNFIDACYVAGKYEKAKRLIIEYHLETNIYRKNNCFEIDLHHLSYCQAILELHKHAQQITMDCKLKIIVGKNNGHGVLSNACQSYVNENSSRLTNNNNSEFTEQTGAMIIYFTCPRNKTSQLKLPKVDTIPRPHDKFRSRKQSKEPCTSLPKRGVSIASWSSFGSNNNNPPQGKEKNGNPEIFNINDPHQFPTCGDQEVTLLSQKNTSTKLDMTALPSPDSKEETGKGTTLNVDDRLEFPFLGCLDLDKPKITEKKGQDPTKLKKKKTEEVNRKFPFSEITKCLNTYNNHPLGMDKNALMPMQSVSDLMNSEKLSLCDRDCYVDLLLTLTSLDNIESSNLAEKKEYTMLLKRQEKIFLDLYNNEYGPGTKAALEPFYNVVEQSLRERDEIGSNRKDTLFALKDPDPPTQSTLNYFASDFIPKC